MSRAFTKEHDIVDPTLPERTVYRATPATIDVLRGEFAVTADAARRKDLADRLAIAQAVEPPADPTTASFGATVTVRDDDGSQYRYTIVGDDDFDLASGRIGESSPLARALTGARAGQTVTWDRPIGPKPLTVESVSYS
jgi:transcription elongation GreA/GreB family factor